MITWHGNNCSRHTEFTLHDSPDPSPTHLSKRLFSFLGSCAPIDLSAEIDRLQAAFSLRSSFRLDINLVQLSLFYRTRDRHVSVRVTHFRVSSLSSRFGHSTFFRHGSPVRVLSHQCYFGTTRCTVHCSSRAIDPSLLCSID